MTHLRLKRMSIAIVAVAALALAGCAGDAPQGNKKTFGTLIGAAAGGLAGSQIGSGRGQLAATAVGALIGAFVGNSVGDSLDRADQTYAAQAEQRALETLPSGSAAEWSNPDTGHYGVVEPTRTYQSPQGAYCREYQHTVYVGGQPQQAYGHACRQPDGSWQIVG